MKTELQFLDYIEKQIISAGEKIYTAWLKQEISFRKSELENNHSPQSTGEDGSMLPKASIRQQLTNDVGIEPSCKPETLGDTNNSTKQQTKSEILKDYEKGCGEWIPSYYEDGDHTHREDVQCGEIDYFGKPILCGDCLEKEKCKHYNQVFNKAKDCYVCEDCGKCVKSVFPEQEGVKDAK
jgi:hypothetical protein